VRFGQQSPGPFTPQYTVMQPAQQGILPFDASGMPALSPIKTTTGRPTSSVGSMSSLLGTLGTSLNLSQTSLGGIMDAAGISRVPSSTLSTPPAPAALSPRTPGKPRTPAKTPRKTKSPAKGGDNE
jgi:hypothetical protein